MVGQQASTDGSVMTAHSCDGNYRTWLQIEPRRVNPAGSQRPIYWGKLHTETPDDMRNLQLKGSIPEVEQTYRYFNVAYPAMNEKGLAIGETTIGGRRELRNDEGLFLIENLQAIALERTTTARDAIRVIGDLVQQYGYGDWGECLTFADSKEVWHFEIMGAGPMEVGAVWAAVRIPDGHVGVSANIPRISTLDLDDPNHYMASENVFSLAEELGYWDPESGQPFKWWKAYGNVDREGNSRPPYSVREFYILSTLAPSLNLTRDMEELPFSVRPDAKVSVRDVLAYYRETYEGTEFDMTGNLTVTDRSGEMVKSPMVNNWNIGRDWGQLLNTLKPGTVDFQRTIAVQQCSYSQVIQARDWLPPEIGTVAWFSFDNPGQSPRIPIWAGVTELPESFKTGCQKSYREDSACWWFRRANRLAQIKWGWAREYLEGAVMEFEDQAFDEVPLIEQKALDLMHQELASSDDGNEDPMTYRQFLTRYTSSFSRATMQKWWELGDFLWAGLARGW
ncbi:MAG: peptidase [Gemmatimonas sp. SG8_17]|nr:MAG: peptidase [Gemmatimonas sp. SG8_17]